MQLKLNSFLTRRSKRRRANERGAALITALGLLMLFMILGTAYVGYMNIAEEESRLSLQDARARNLAKGGIYAAIGSIQDAIKAGEAPAESLEFEIPLYMRDSGGLNPFPQRVAVTVFDESSLININHVEREVLEALGIDRSAARDIRNKLPRREIPSLDARYWFSSIEELRTRGFVDGRTYQKINKDLLTVHTVRDTDNAAGFININSASPEVLSVLFNLTPAQAEATAAKRPFTSWDDAVAKIGTAPGTYNVLTGMEGEPAMPRELALSSRCFRLSSTARMINKDTTRFGMTSTAEAVVVFDDSGNFSFRYWSEVPSERTEPPELTLESIDPAAAATGEAAPEAEATPDEAVAVDEAPAAEETAAEAPADNAAEETTEEAPEDA